MICCQYNNKSADLLLGGCYNGVLNHFDLRKGPSPVLKSPVETSHYDPVYDLTWLQSKTQTEAVTVSSDGRLMMWDTRDGLAAPVESYIFGFLRVSICGSVPVLGVQYQYNTDFKFFSEKLCSTGKIAFCSKWYQINLRVLLTDGMKDNAKVLGGVSLEWMQEAGPTKYLVGTEMGMTLYSNI